MGEHVCVMNIAVMSSDAKKVHGYARTFAAALKQGNTLSWNYGNIRALRFFWTDGVAR
jgi:hypothetical protein